MRPRSYRVLSWAALAAVLTRCGGGPPPPLSATGEDWPMYGHDPQRSGFSPTEGTLGVENVAALAERFRVDVGMGPLPSSSTPVVAGGRVCVGSSVPVGDNFFCFDAATGARLWSADVGHSPPFPGNVGIGSTAAIADGVVVVGGGDAAYYGLDAATGARLWRHDMAAGPEAFAWSSPLVSRGVAYVGISSRYDAVRGELRALDLHSGAVVARRHFVPEGRRGADVWNSPSLSPDGGTVVVATGNDAGGFDAELARAIVALDPQSLAIRAADQVAAFGQDLDFGSTPVFFSDATGRVLVGANQKDGRFCAYEADKISDGPLWTRPVGLSVGFMPAYDPRTGPGGTLLVAGDNLLLYGVDPATGEDRFPPTVAGIGNGTFAVVNGLVFSGAGNGAVAVTATATGRLVRRLEPAEPGPTFSGPIVSHGVVYWMSGRTLNAWGVS